MSPKFYIFEKFLVSQNWGKTSNLLHEKWIIINGIVRKKKKKI